MSWKRITETTESTFEMPEGYSMCEGGNCPSCQSGIAPKEPHMFQLLPISKGWSTLTVSQHLRNLALEKERAEAEERPSDDVEQSPAEAREREFDRTEDQYERESIRALDGPLPAYLRHTSPYERGY